MVGDANKDTCYRGTRQGVSISDVFLVRIHTSMQSHASGDFPGAEEGDQATAQPTLAQACLVDWLGGATSMLKDALTSQLR